MTYRLQKNIIFMIVISMLGILLGGGNSVMGMPDFTFIFIGDFFLNGALDGFLIAQCLGWYHLLISMDSVKLTLRALPAALVIFINTVIYLFLILFGRALGLYITGRTAEFSLITQDESFANGIFFGILALLILKTLYQMSFLLGPKFTLNFFTGKYHRPKVEERYIMFLDLKDSTAITESIGNDSYLKLLDRLLYEITEPLFKSKGEIYKYIGDEVVITWIRNCSIDTICTFFEDYTERLKKYSDYFKRTFNVSPQFRGGLHLGNFTIAEIGEVKKEIALIGDSINTAARITEKCKELDAGLLISEQAITSEPYNHRLIREGSFRLKGISEEITLYNRKPINVAFS